MGSDIKKFVNPKFLNSIDVVLMRDLFARLDATVGRIHTESYLATEAWRSAMRLRLAAACAAGAGCAVAMRLPSGLKRASTTLSACPPSEKSGLPVFTTQSLARLSSLPVITYVPSGLKDVVKITPRCPLSNESGLPVRASQILAVWSLLPVTKRVPSGLKATASTNS